MYDIYLAAPGGGGSPKYSLEVIQEAIGGLLSPEQLQENLQSASDAAGSNGSWGLLVFFFMLAIGVSFFCSVWEAALLSVTRPYIAHLKKKRPKAGAKLEHLKSHIDRPLISILTLNTIAHTFGAMGVASELTKITNGGWMDTVGGVVMTLAILIASEIIPKNLGARKWKAWAPWVANCLHTLTFLMTPIVKFIGMFSKGGHGEDTFSRDELTVMAEMGKMEGKLKEDESRILRNTLMLREMTVEDVMTPRVVMFSLIETTTIGEFLEEHDDTPFSRIPVYLESKDDITGFALKDEILLAGAKDKLDMTLSEIKRDVAMVSELTNLPDAFSRLNKHKHHAAIVHDEFGGVTGLVTMEDILETLVGREIMDEVDTRADLQAFARKQWEKRSRRKGIHMIDDDGSDLSDEDSDE